MTVISVNHSFVIILYLACILIFLIIKSLQCRITSYINYYYINININININLYYSLINAMLASSLTSFRLPDTGTRVYKLQTIVCNFENANVP